VPYNSYGETYGAHREFLEFSQAEHKELMAYCTELGIGYSTSVWDPTSAREMAELQPSFLKIPSACNLNFPLLRELFERFNGEIHLSTGMTTKDEIEKIVKFFEENKASDRLVIYNCVSGYPVPFEDICLLDILYLKEKYAERVKAIGFSGHHLGIAPDIAAFVLGAEWIERHYTLDRTWKGTDHAASLEPGGLRKLVRDLKNTSMSLQFKKSDILKIEQEQRDKLKSNSIKD
ncbi:MAG: N-acetylneuraminate synthase family protein, partial [Bdellovibrionales bacterium]